MKCEAPQEEKNLLPPTAENVPNSSLIRNFKAAVEITDEGCDSDFEGRFNKPASLASPFHLEMWLSQSRTFAGFNQSSGESSRC